MKVLGSLILRESRDKGIKRNFKIYFLTHEQTLFVHVSKIRLRTILISI